MKKNVLLLIIAILLSGCKSSHGTIPEGTWKYDILINGVSAGEATTTVSADKGNYTTVSFMKITTGEVVNTVTQTVVETIDFKPVSLSTQNRIIHGGTVEKIDTSAVFSGNRVSLTTGDSTRDITITKPFVLDGMIIMHELLRKKFKKGTEITFSIYDPSIEIEEPISVRMLVMGEELVSIGDKEEKLIHVLEAIVGIKNIDLYVDRDGNTHKAVITMLNSMIELVLKK